MYAFVRVHSTVMGFNDTSRLVDARHVMCCNLAALSFFIAVNYAR